MGVVCLKYHEEKFCRWPVKLQNLLRFSPLKVSHYKLHIMVAYQFVYIGREELKCKPSLNLKSGKRITSNMKWSLSITKYDHVPGLVSEYLSFSSLPAIASSLTTLLRKASMRVRHVLGFEFFCFGLYTPLNQWLNTPFKQSSSFPLIVSNVPSSTPMHLPMSLHLALASQRALFTSFRSAISKLSN